MRHKSILRALCLAICIFLLAAACGSSVGAVTATASTPTYSLTDIIAGLALILSVFALFLQWLDKRPRLHIDARVTTWTPHGTGFSMPVLFAYITNPGERPIYVQDVWLFFGKNQQIQLPEFSSAYRQTTQPFTLESLRGQRFIVPGDWLGRELQKFVSQDTVRARVSVRDETNHRYKSRPIKISISKLREPNQPLAQA